MNLSSISQFTIWILVVPANNYSTVICGLPLVDCSHLGFVLQFILFHFQIILTFVVIFLLNSWENPILTFFMFSGRAALQKRIMTLLRKIEHCTPGCLQVKFHCIIYSSLDPIFNIFLRHGKIHSKIGILPLSSYSLIQKLAWKKGKPMNLFTDQPATGEHLIRARNTNGTWGLFFFCWENTRGMFITLLLKLGSSQRVG